MVSLWNIICIFTGILGYIFFNITIKRSNNKTFTCLAAYIWCNILLFLGFFTMQAIRLGSLHGACSKLRMIIFTNIELSISASLIMLIMSIIFAYLIENYPLSNVVMVLQLGVPLSTIGYALCGNMTTPIQLTGVILITLGALVSGFKKFTFPNIFTPLLSIPLSLYALGMFRSSICVGGKILAFIASQKTTETLDFYHLVDNFDVVWPGTNKIENVLYFIVGRTPFIIITFFLYLLYKEQFSLKKMIKHGKKDLTPVLAAGLAVCIYTVLYYYVFETIEHKSVLSALNKFKILFTIIIAHVILKEEITLPKKVAAALIITGGALAAF